MKLFYELDSIDKTAEDEEFFWKLVKFYQSQPADKIYADINAYDIAALDPGKKSIFVNMAKRCFVYGPEKRDITDIMEYDNGLYDIKRMSTGRLVHA